MLLLLRNTRSLEYGSYIGIFTASGWCFDTIARGLLLLFTIVFFVILLESSSMFATCPELRRANSNCFVHQPYTLIPIA